MGDERVVVDDDPFTPPPDWAIERDIWEELHD